MSHHCQYTSCFIDNFLVSYVSRIDLYMPIICSISLVYCMDFELSHFNGSVANYNKILSPNFVENMLKKTWKNLRDNLSKCLKKRELLSRSGAGATELPQCKFFKELQFLKDVLSNRSTHSNLSTPQLSVDNFDRFEYIEDTSTSKKPDVMYSTPKPMQSGTETPPAKRKRASGTKEGKATSKDEQSSTSSLDSAISEYLANQNDEKKNADSLFCQSLVPILSSLPARKNRIAKFEIQKLLYDIEFSDD